MTAAETISTVSRPNGVPGRHLRRRLADSLGPPQLIPAELRAKGAVYPPLRDIRNISKQVALAVMKTAARGGHLGVRLA